MAGCDQRRKSRAELLKHPLSKLFNEFRSSEDAAYDFLTRFEGVEDPIGQHGLDFCKSYVITLLCTYCKETTNDHSKRKWDTASKEDKVELLLVSFGLLAGYEVNETLQVREDEYYKLASCYNPLLRKMRKSKLGLNDKLSSGSVHQRFIEVSDYIADELDTTLKAEMSKHDGKLDLIKITPKKLTLPAPRKRADESTASDGLSILIDSAGGQIVPQETEESKQDNEGNVIETKEKTSGGNIDGVPPESDPPPEPVIRAKEGHNLLNELFAKRGFCVFACIVAVLFFFLSALVWCSIDGQRRIAEAREDALKYRVSITVPLLCGGEYTFDRSLKDYNRSSQENAYHNLNPKLFADDSEHILGDLVSKEED